MSFVTPPVIDGPDFYDPATLRAESALQKIMGLSAPYKLYPHQQAMLDQFRAADDTIDVDARLIDDVPQLVFDYPPCKDFAAGPAPSSEELAVRMDLFKTQCDIFNVDACAIAAPPMLTHDTPGGGDE
jgi:hypothetical protein